jgi:hypothetical protein
MENLTDSCLRSLDRPPPFGYDTAGVGSPEVTAICALAFRAHGHVRRMHESLRWLAAAQADDGSVRACGNGVDACWPTGLAVMAWASAATCPPDKNLENYARAAEKGIAWMLGHPGVTMARDPMLGHDTSLSGWAWVQGSHPWVIPTAFNLLALKATGRGDHPKAREAAKLLVDRQLRDGGCNYGNTTVLGQELRPQLEPTGLAMAALAGESDPGGRVRRSLDYLEKGLTERTPAPSLCYGLLGLAAHGRRPEGAAGWLARCYERAVRKGNRPLNLGLLCLASSSRRSLLFGEHP